MIFLHIGLNKSGSSSIQAFCDRHRSVLWEHGLDYPKIGIHDAAHYGVSNLLIGRPGEVQTPDPTEVARILSDSIRARRHIVLSSEYFFLADDAEVAHIRRQTEGLDAEFRIIIYLRRHDQWIASLFNQALKTVPRYAPWQSDIRDYTLHLLGSREFELRYSVILDRWAKQFGDEAIIVRPFEACQFLHGDPVWDFLAQIDPALSETIRGLGIVPKRVNESMPEHLLRAVDAVRSSGIDPDQARPVISHLLRARSSQAVAKHGKRQWDGRMFELTPPLRRSIVRMFEDDYRYVAQRYLKSPNELLFSALKE